jgi:hypothetical protein
VAFRGNKGGHSERAWSIGIIGLEDPSRLAFRGLHLGRGCICKPVRFWGLIYRTSMKSRI